MDSLKIDRIPFKKQRIIIHDIYIYHVPTVNNGFWQPKKTYSQHHANMLPLPRCCACFLTCVRIKALSYLDSKRIPQSLGVLSGQTDSTGTKESGPLHSRYSLNEIQGSGETRKWRNSKLHIDLIFKLEWNLIRIWMSMNVASIPFVWMYGTYHVFKIAPNWHHFLEVYKMNTAKSSESLIKHSHAKKLKPPAGGMELGQSRFHLGNRV